MLLSKSKYLSKRVNSDLATILKGHSNLLSLNDTDLKMAFNVKEGASPHLPLTSNTWLLPATSAHILMKHYVIVSSVTYKARRSRKSCKPKTHNFHRALKIESMKQDLSIPHNS